MDLAESLIGIHVYSIKLYQNRKPKAIPLSDTGDGAKLKLHCPRFIERYSEIREAEDQLARAWYFEPFPQSGASYHGLIRYGSSGYESDILDRSTREMRYQRRVNDIDVIPLYYRFWIPDTGNYALVALQTFGQRSCVGRVWGAFKDSFRDTNDGFRAVWTPVVPAQLASFRTAEVKSISLVKHDYSSDSAENQVGSSGDLVDLEVSFNAKRRENLGVLATLTDRIKGKSQKVLEYNNTLFDEATAEVSIGGKRRKVTLIGPSQNTGKIDVTEGVSRGPNGHPKFESISHEVEKILTSIATGD